MGDNGALQSNHRKSRPNGMCDLFRQIKQAGIQTEVIGAVRRKWAGAGHGGGCDGWGLQNHENDEIDVRAVEFKGS